ncbi:ferric reductase like transmembrane component-domain-containing protein [Cercophora scortea]|uniref:ferric-chelate reductase (NADPH) n=1 Tax=Cercophora scortea TaxID=314031 RepID=A0AAE0MMV5_9PEZI|nr:ferric reductase like transmembrane component-domain-containing protein [Cercophora scortea]
MFKDFLWWTLGILALVVLGIRIIELLWAKLRLVSAMSVPGDRQGFWKVSQWSWMPTLKRRLIYAPLWKKRHYREIRLSKALNMGTLPSRLHTIILLGYLGSNLAYTFIVNWATLNKYQLCAEIRGRSGTLALVNMVPLIIFAGRNNPLIGMLKISFDTYNLLHRWMGRIVVIETLIHVIVWSIVQVADGGWASVQEKIMNDRFIGSGTVGTFAMVILLVLSVSPLRHAFYETFLTTHIILAFIAFVGTWLHCVATNIAGGLPQLPWIYAIMSIWFAERLARMIRLAYCNWSGRGHSQAFVEAMPGETCRVKIQLPRYVDVKPGQHAYIRFSGVHSWENHPFSIAWVEHTYEEILPVSEKDMTKVEQPISTSVSFVIGAQTGFTRSLYNAANNNDTRSISMRAAFEGPYAGHHSLDSYGHVVLFAGATGITHQISYLKHLIEGYTAGIVATRRITLVWIIRDYESLEWVRPWMDKILRLPGRRDLLQVKLFVTRPKSAREVFSTSSTVQMFPGRPNIPHLLTKEVQEQMGAMCVTVCGPGGLADDVRDAVRKVQDQRQVVDLHCEAFTW